MSRKPRSDSKLDNLPDHQLMALRDGLLSTWGYEDAISWCAVECGVSTTLPALSAFWRRHCEPVLKDRRRLAVMKAEGRQAAADGNPLDFGAKAMEEIEEIYYQMVLDPDSEPSTVKKYGDLIAKFRKLEVDNRKIALLERKADFADEVKKQAENRDGGVTAEDMAEIERRLKLM